eukprot:6172926-Pleurochrysis_carterae.AAC.2
MGTTDRRAGGGDKGDTGGGKGPRVAKIGSKGAQNAGGVIVLAAEDTCLGGAGTLDTGASAGSSGESVVNEGSASTDCS